jgi:hypothetical protein
MIMAASDLFKYNRLGGSALLVVALLMSVATNSIWAKDLSNRELVDKESAKNANIQEAQKLNGEAPVASKSKDAPAQRDALGGASTLSDSKNKHDAKETADVVNQVPGVKVKSADLEPPTAPPIKGFHPIKKLLRPVENLEGMTVKLEQQIMKLEGPIASLQPPMINLQKKMNKVDDHLGLMEGRLSGMSSQVNGVREDIANMRKDIQELKTPIQQLRGPIGSVAKPLEAVQNQLSLILLAILVAAAAVAIGTPVAAVLMYKNRHKLFPGMSDHDMPKVVQPDKEPVSARR